MLTKFLVTLTVLAMSAFAGSIPGKIASGNVLISTPAVVKGTSLKPGTYRVTVLADKAIFSLGSETKEIAVKVENSPTKFDGSKVQYEKTGSGSTISEICLGGTKLKLVFN